MRFFSHRQKVFLYLRAEGRCESCGVPLEPGWHADHKKPWSRGGETTIRNGAALCPTCNQMKGSTPIMTDLSDEAKDPREAWQSAAVEKFLTSDSDSFLVTATPAAGKTRMALRAANEMLASGDVDRVIVVAPSDHLTKQWAREAMACHKLDLTRQMTQALNCDGLVTTYQAVASNPFQWAEVASLGRTLVILDEVHHCGEPENAKWGEGVSTAFSDCPRRLLLSGTPFRTDGTPIPFIRYDADGVSISHAGISFKKALADGIIRPIRFVSLDGSAKWLEDLDERESTISGASKKDRSKVLATIRKSDGDWIRGALEKADAELKRIRKEEMPDAGGLVIANSVRHADNYAKLLSSISGTDVSVAHSGVEDPSKVIAEFSKDGSKLWLVSVAMVSEGVDIPRLSVGVHATSKDTEMLFRQIVGRFVRRHNGKGVTSTLLIPDVQSLVDRAKRVEEEVREALSEAQPEDRPQGDGRGDGSYSESSTFIPLVSSVPQDSDVICPGGVIVTPAEVGHAGRLAQEVGGSLLTAHASDVAILLRRAGFTFDEEAPVPVEAPVVTGDERRKKRRDMVNRLVNEVHTLTGAPYNQIHSKLNSKFGGPLPAASEESLQARIDYLNSKLSEARSSRGN